MKINQIIFSVLVFVLSHACLFCAADQPIVEERTKIDQYFDRYEGSDINAMTDLLYAVKHGEFKLLLGMDECDGCNCKLTRKRFPQRRKFFEDKVLSEFKYRLLHNLVKTDENGRKVLSLNYCEYAAGELFQTFVLLNRLIRLIKRELPAIHEICLSIELVELEPYENKQWFKSLESYLKNTPDVRLVQAPANGYDLVVCVDMSYYLSDCVDPSMSDFASRFGLGQHFRTLVRCLKNGGLFFNLNKYGEGPKDAKERAALMQRELTQLIEKRNPELSENLMRESLAQAIYQLYKFPKDSLLEYEKMDVIEPMELDAFFKRIYALTPDLYSPCLYFGIVDENFRKHEKVSVCSLKEAELRSVECSIVGLSFSNMVW